jgi:hypothetical protein
MITLLFILLKLSATTTLNWGWIILALILDFKDEIGTYLNKYYDPRDADKITPCNCMGQAQDYSNLQ